MKYTVFRLVLLYFLLLNTGYASIYNVILTDNDGPVIQGQVDTETDTFTVTSWTENGGGTTFYNPDLGQFPLSYSAKNSSNGAYDVPDDWDGTIDGSWGFLSNKSNKNITWTNGNVTSDREHGWGAGTLINGNIVTSENQTKWVWSPTSLVGTSTATFNTVSVTPVPEFSTSMFVAVFFMMLTGIKLYKRKIKS